MANKEKQKKAPFFESDIACHSFKNMDKNGDGKISELLHVMQTLSDDFAEEDVTRMMEKVSRTFKYKVTSRMLKISVLTSKSSPQTAQI